MIGLIYVRNWIGMTMEELAAKLETTKQNISLWENDAKRKIPKRYLPILQEMFGVPEEYFQKELLEIDELNVQEFMLNKQLAESAFVYEDEIYDSGTGNTIMVEQEHYDKNTEEYLEAIKVDKKELLLVVKLKQSIRSTDKNGFNINEITSLSAYTSCKDDNIKLYDRFINIVNRQNINNKLLHEIMRAIELLDEQLSDKNIIWGEENPMDISIVSDENSVVQEIFSALKKDSIEKYIKREENIKLAKEIMNEFGLTEKDLL